ncbi:DNA replication complex GINS protein psf-3 [Pseudomassariella vexata]|uniref:DNA replication complex GINS protein PSF3 n=1 Tax=Pseudomassariella vexata TaxID=1141098 RepID=A0A1Y2DH61_9PEZI|nr:DNA replication complex GINS protein psf-3 [Pseudomassariella vexata]ORY58466.1 DNA replication complex GINS protein psf-3 [Pseudomassariella vexata]
MSYYDLDVILTDSEKVPCKFELEVPDLGYLDNNPSQPLKAGTSVNLPLWLAELLALTHQSSTPFLTLSLPPALGDNVLNALKADPRAVPLRDQSQNFYGLGARMLDLFEEPELGVVLRRSFVVRAGEVALHGRKAGATGDAGSAEDFMRGLEEWEKKLYRQAHEGAKGHKEWMDGVKK